jgi:hypothetical protein
MPSFHCLAELETSREKAAQTRWFDPRFGRSEDLLGTGRQEVRRLAAHRMQVDS